MRPAPWRPQPGTQGSLKRDLQSCCLLGRRAGSRRLYHCLSPTRAAALGLGPFSAFASCSSKVAGGTWVSTSSFPTNCRTKFFVTEGISGQDLAVSTTKGSQRVKCPLGVAVKQTTLMWCDKVLLRATQRLLLFRCSAESNSLHPQGLQHARPPCPSPMPGVYSNPCALGQ